MFKLSFKMNSDFYALGNHSDEAINVLTKNQAAPTSL